MKIKASILIMTLVLVSGCGSAQNGQSTSVGSSNGIESGYVCGMVGDIFVGYNEYLSKWRDASNNVPFDELFSYSDEASLQLQTLAESISTEGIDWDSGAIISSFILNMAAGIEEISSSTQNRFFAPGRDLNALLQDIALNADSVVTSACQ